jgi:hypothetical protein
LNDRQSSVGIRRVRGFILDGGEMVPRGGIEPPTLRFSASLQTMSYP